MRPPAPQEIQHVLQEAAPSQFIEDPRSSPDIVRPHAQHQADHIRIMLTNWQTGNFELLSSRLGITQADFDEIKRILPLAFVDASFLPSPTHQTTLLEFCGATKKHLAYLRIVGEGVLSTAVGKLMYTYADSEDSNLFKDRLTDIKACSKYFRLLGFEDLLLRDLVQAQTQPATDKMCANAYTLLLGVMFTHLPADIVFGLLNKTLHAHV